MIRKIILSVSLLATANILFAKSIQLQDIIQGDYKETKISQLYSMADGEHYTQMNDDQTLIIRYAYKTGNAIDTLFNTSKAKECPFKKFDGYKLSNDEKKILLWSDQEPIYRHSFKANYYTYEIRRNLVKPLSEGAKQQAAIFSPNGRMVAFVRDNNIFLKKLDFGTESAITTDGSSEKIINGVPDWVHEEEFGQTISMAWSSDDSYLTFIKYNESEVPQYIIPLYQGLCPSLDQYTNYPGYFSYKYPVAGVNNAVVGVYSYSVESKAVRKLDVPIENDGYIVKIEFMPTPDIVAVATLNRHQNVLSLFGTNCKSGVSKLLIQDKSETWIDYQNLDYLHFYPDFFVFASSKSGYRHLYQYNLLGEEKRVITKGDYDITDYIGYHAPSKTFYYQSTKEGPLYRSIYKVDTAGKEIKLSSQSGTNNATMNSTGTYMTIVYNSTKTPNEAILYDNQGKRVRALYNNNALASKIQALQLPNKEFFTFDNREGISLNGWMLKPNSFDPSKKYPVVMLQYSGPGSQLVLDKWSIGWEYYLAAQGYVVACVDGRGTGGRGYAFATSIYRNLGLMESNDQIDAAHFVGNLSYCDKRNIAIWGWSFGGYTTLMGMSMGNSAFKAGIAIAPVVDWRFYDTIYTERYMRTPKENNDGYNATSPLLHADKLKGQLLIVSGTADDNVHVQNTLQYSEALVQANIQFDMQLYTNRNHNISGCNTRLHLYTKCVDFLNKQLKK